MNGDMLDTLKDYDEDDQKSIMRTLTAVQKNGWNHGQDPFWPSSALLDPILIKLET